MKNDNYQNNGILRIMDMEGNICADIYQNAPLWKVEEVLEDAYDLFDEFQAVYEFE